MRLLAKDKHRHQVTALPRLMLAGALLIGLAGCSNNDFSDLERFVEEVKSRPAGRPDPLPEFKTYETYAYTVGAMRDPFSRSVDEEMILPSDNGGIQPSVRHKEALEQFPLDTLNYVGSMQQDEDSWAIITAPDGIVHRVRVGNYVGQNHGQITSVSEGQIEIDEIVPDGIGGWMKRKAALGISE